MALTTMLDSCGHTLECPQLYKSDPEFDTTYQMLLEGKKVPNFHLQDVLLCHLGHLCIPSSKRAKTIWEAHYSRVAGHFGLEKTVAVLQKYFISQTFNKMLGSTSDPILPAISKPTIKKQGLYTPFHTPTNPGNPFPWITCRVFLLPSMEKTVFSWSSTDSPRWPFSWPAKRVSKHEPLPNSSLNKCGYTLGSHNPLSQIGTTIS